MKAAGAMDHGLILAQIKGFGETQSRVHARWLKQQPHLYSFTRETKVAGCRHLKGDRGVFIKIKSGGLMDNNLPFGFSFLFFFYTCPFCIHFPSPPLGLTEAVECSFIFLPVAPDSK